MVVSEDGLWFGCRTFGRGILPSDVGDSAEKPVGELKELVRKKKIG
jgi:hypothetical protein